MREYLTIMFNVHIKEHSICLLQLHLLFVTTEHSLAVIPHPLACHSLTSARLLVIVVLWGLVEFFSKQVEINGKTSYLKCLKKKSVEVHYRRHGQRGQSQVPGHSQPVTSCPSGYR